MKKPKLQLSHIVVHREEVNLNELEEFVKTYQEVKEKYPDAYYIDLAVDVLADHDIIEYACLEVVKVNPLYEQYLKDKKEYEEWEKKNKELIENHRKHVKEKIASLREEINKLYKTI